MGMQHETESKDAFETVSDEKRRQEIGKRVRERREELGMSRAEAYEASGITTSTWQRIEEGSSGPTRHKTRARITEALRWEPGTFEDPVPLPHFPDLSDITIKTAIDLDLLGPEDREMVAQMVATMVKNMRLRRDQGAAE